MPRATRRAFARIWAVFILTGFVTAPTYAAGFITAPTYAAGLTPWSVAVGDFNGDGILDIVLVNYAPDPGGAMSILLGSGHGSFQAPQTYSVGAFPISVVVGDFNSDGILDLAVGEQSGVGIWLGNGDGTFQAAQTYPAQAGSSLVVADFNGDGKPDIATSGGSLLLGNGDGTFQPAQDYGASGAAIGVGDFNGDRIPDLALVDPANRRVSVLVGNGDGTFRLVSQNATDASAYSVAVGDFNGDGLLDFAVNEFGPAFKGTILTFLGNGDGTFQPPMMQEGPWGPVVAADFNGDGKLDLAVKDSAGASILLGNGDGTFQVAQGYTASIDPIALAVGDFNGDGIPDLVVANLSRTVSLLLGNGHGSFQAARSYPTSGNDFDSLVLADFNGDGIPDLAVADFFLGSTVTIFLGKGDGTFLLTSAFSAGDGFSRLAVGDFNGDTKIDIVASTYYVDRFGVVHESDLRVYLGNGDGTFQSAQIVSTGFHPGSIAVGDFNGDGILDLAVANLGDFPSLGSMVSILLGNGDGSFQAGQSYVVGVNPSAVAVGDFNGDGILDLAVSSTGDARGQNFGVTILLGNGDGTFGAAQNYTFGAAQNYAVAGISLIVADFNGDGRLDLAVASGSAVNVLLGNGDGSFQAPQSYPFPPNGVLASLVVGDFNGDGIPDLAVASEDAVNVLLGVGDGTFKSAQSFAAPINGYSAVAADFNGDGFTDLFVHSSDGAAVITLLNTADWNGGP